MGDEGRPLFTPKTSYDEIWRWYRDKHRGHMSEDELRKIHIKWKRIAAEVKNLR